MPEPAVPVAGYSDDDVTVAAGDCLVAELVVEAGGGAASPFTDLKRACITLCLAGTGVDTGSGARVAVDFFRGILGRAAALLVRAGCDAAISLYRPGPFGATTAYELRTDVHWSRHQTVNKVESVAAPVRPTRVPGPRDCADSRRH